MNVLDENIPLDQCDLLRAWGIHCRVIGRDLSELSATDENITVVLHRLKKPTFFTRDEDFFRKDLCHHAYGLAFLDVRPAECADFIRRFLRHHGFLSKARRLGIVARVHHDGIHFWELDRSGLQRTTWSGNR